VITVVAIATAAAITAGLLALAGVGEGETSDARINRMAKEIAADTVRESPSFCAPGDRYPNYGASFIDIVFESSTLSSAEHRALEERVLEELQRLCRESRR
jgi:hypothetical protein